MRTIRLPMSKIPHLISKDESTAIEFVAETLKNSLQDCVDLLKLYLELRYSPTAVNIEHAFDVGKTYNHDAYSKLPLKFYNVVELQFDDECETGLTFLEMKYPGIATSHDQLCHVVGWTQYSSYWNNP